MKRSLVSNAAASYRRGASALALMAMAFAVTAPAFAQTTAQPAVVAPAAAASPVYAPTPQVAAAWGISGHDVPFDPAVLLGVLPNGMRYAIRRNTTPLGSVILRMRYDVGSIAEAEDQRGLAHFIEHMAFNGSTHIAEGEMIPLLERNGLAFGPDTNASTGIDETVYKLDLPRNDAALIDTGLMLLRETASELTLSEAAVERERGVIAAEVRTRDNFQLRNQIDSLQFALPDSPIARRLPSGSAEVIRNAPVARLRALYDAYYRPERATLVVVGDVDVAEMERKIRTRFADWRGRGAAGAPLDFGSVAVDRPTAADIYVQPDLPETVAIEFLKPIIAEPDSRARRLQRSLEGIGTSILNRRLRTMALAPDARFIRASFGITAVFDRFLDINLSAIAQDGQWQPAMEAVDLAYRQFLQFGVSEAEIAEQVADVRTSLDNGVRGAETRESAGLASGIVGTLSNRRSYATPIWVRDLFNSYVADITPETVMAAVRQRVAGSSPPLVRVTSKQDVAGGEAAILAAFARAQTVAATAPVARAAQSFAYTDFGTPGRVVADTMVAEHGIRRIRFANNVMLNIKRTDFDAGTILVGLRVDGGNLLATRQDPTRVALASAFTLGGLEAHSVDDLRTILAGRTVSPGIGAGTDNFGSSAATTRADLLLQAQLMAAFVTHPGYRPEGLALLRRALPQRYATNDATPGAVIGRDVGAILANDDPRFATPSLDTMLALDWGGLRAAMADSLANGAIEIGLVGDLDEAAAIDAIARTFGALPMRRAEFDPHTAARQISFATDHSPRTLVHEGPGEQAVAMSYWQARDDSDLGETLRLELLGQVMQLMLTDELRERLGTTYTPSAGANLSSDYTGYGHLYASAAINVRDLATTEAAFDAIAARLRDTPISADMVTRARAPWLESMRRSRRENSYWLGYVGGASSEPDQLAKIAAAIPSVEAATAEELQILARRYLTQERLIRIRAVGRPENVTAAPAAAPPANPPAVPAAAPAPGAH